MEDVFVKVSDWLRESRHGWWLMVLDGADDDKYLFEKETSADTFRDGRSSLPEAPHRLHTAGGAWEDPSHKPCTTFRFPAC